MVKSIDNSHLTHIEDLATQDKLLETGNLQIIFHIDTPEGIPFEVEMFAEGLGHGHTQPGYIPREGNHHIMIDDVKIKLASPEATADLYTLNFLKEMFNNDVKKHGNKTKDASRIESLIRHLQETGDKDPNKIIARMYEVEGRYRFPLGRDAPPIKLSPVLEDIFSEIPNVEKMLKPITRSFDADKKVKMKEDAKKGENELNNRPVLPEFQEFIETWKKNKGEIHVLYRELLDNHKPSYERM